MAWEDSSGNNHDATQATGTKEPAVVANVLNGYEVRRFDGGDSLKATFGSALTQPTTIFAVAKWDVTGANPSKIMYDGITTGARNVVAEKLGDFMAFNGGSEVFFADADTNFHVFTNVFAAASTSYGALDGTGATLAGMGSHGLGGLQIGEHVSGGRFFDGDIAEIIVISGALSTANRQGVETYLANKYGLTISHSATEVDPASLANKKLWLEPAPLPATASVYLRLPPLGQSLTAEVSTVTPDSASVRLVLPPFTEALTVSVDAPTPDTASLRLVLPPLSQALTADVSSPVADTASLRLVLPPLSSEINAVTDVPEDEGDQVGASSGALGVQGIADLRIVEQANGGQVELSGRVAASVVEANPSVFVKGAEVLVKIQETGDTWAWGRLKQPALGSGAVELTAEGPAKDAEGYVKRMFFESRILGDWNTQEARGVGKRPNKAPNASLGGAGNVNVGIHKYRVTYVSADGETNPGPVEEIDVTASAKQVELRGIPKGPKHVTARRIYRTDAGGSTYGLVTTINNNHATTYTDNTADGGLGAAPPSSFTTSDIDASVGKGALVLSAPKHADLVDGQFSGFTFEAIEEKITGVEFDIDKTRDTAAFDVKVHKADEQGSDYVHRSTLSLDEDGPGKQDITIRSGPEIIRVGLFKDGTDADLGNALNVKLSDVIVRGRATESDDTTSDVFREVCSELGVSSKYVKESGFPAMPQDWVGVTFGEILDFNALITGWIWLFFREGRETVCYFGPWGRHRWYMNDPYTDLSGLIPEDPWTVATVQHREQDGVVRGEVERIADPNPLGRKIYAPPFQLETRANRKMAGALAQRLADFGATPRWAGTFDVHRVQDEWGVWWPAAFVSAGDELWDPREKVWHKADRVEHSPGSGTASITIPTGIPLWDRFNERRAQRRRRR